MTIGAALKKQARLTLVLTAVFMAFLAAIFPNASLPAAGSASTTGITSEVIQSTGGGGFTARRDCPTGYFLETFYFRKLAFDGANAMTMVEGSCRAIAADGLSVTTNGALLTSPPGGYVGSFVAATQYSQQCGSLGSTRVPVGARIYKTQNGYASGYQFICRSLPDTRDSTEYWTNVLSGENPVNNFEDVRCPTGTAVLGLYLTYGSIVDRIGFRCGSITGATQTVTFGSLSNRTLGIDASSFTVTASTNGAGTLGYSSSTPNVCTVNGTTVSLVDAGTCTITAAATSTANWAAGSQAQSFTVQLPAQPTFGTPSPTLDGFTVQITNYQAGLTWTSSASQGVAVSIGNTGLVTVTGLAPGASSTLTINNHPAVSATVTGSALGLCSTSSSSQSGITVVRITNVGACNWLTPDSVSTIQVAVVAGGGGGGFGNIGGGGGAGEVLVTGTATLSGALSNLTVTNISGIATTPGASNLVSIGAGGTSGAPTGATETSANWGAQSATANFGGNGSSTRFGTIVADGGGGGGGTNRAAGAAGGSGGGGGINGAGGQTDNSVPDGWTAFKNVGQPAHQDGKGSGGGAGGPGSVNGGGMGISIWGFKLAGGGGGWGVVGAERSLNDPVLGGNGRLTSGSWPYAGTAPDYTSAGVNGTGTGGGSGAPGGSGVVLIRYAETYTVTYNANGATSGSVPSAQQRDGHGQVALQVNSGNLAKTGFTFGGWSTTADGTSGTSYSASEQVNLTGSLQLFAKWIGNPNTVSFKANFPTAPSDSNQIITSGTPTSLSANTFTRTGYSFYGWNVLANGSSTSYSNSETVSLTGSLTLFAQWVLENYTVTFDYNGATGGNSRVSSSYNVEGPVVTLPIPAKSGYRFEGWYEQSNFSGSVLGSTYTTTQTRTLYASWSPVTFTVLFDYNGATSQNTTASSSYTTGASGISLPAPMRTGHSFAGWFTSSNLVGSAVTAPFTTAVNQTLYAKWSAIDYSISYSAEINVGGSTISATSGTAPIDVNLYNIGNTAVVLANSGGLVRAGYEFGGWVTSSAGTGTALNSGDAITIADANVVLYPKWTPGQYTISYNVNGATGTPARASDTYTTLGSSITLPGVGAMVRSGYTFGGWSATANGSAVSNANFTTTQNVTLYAVWTLTSFAVTFDLNGGSGAAAPSSLNANIEQNITIPGVGSATKTGHWFSGWNTQPDGSGASYGVAQVLKMPLGGADLFAVWVPDQYRISYNANGGVGGPALAGGFDTATFGQPYAIRSGGSLYRAGYNFSHWSTDVAGAGLKYSSDGDGVNVLQQFTPSSNTTFFAQWSPIDYTFSFDPNGGSISPPTQSKTIGQQLALPDPGFKTGYSFAGWSDGAANFQAQTNYLVSDSAIAFVAQWNPNVYRVSFDWQGGIGSPTPNQNYTYGTGGVSLPSIGDRVRDGYSFSGWALSPGGNALASFEPTSDSTLYARWVDGSFSLNYNAQGGTLSSAVTSVGRGTSTVLPTAVRDGFVLQGWYTDPTAGVKIGDAGSTFTPLASQTLHARWIQRSLFGVDLASLENGVELIASSGSSLDTTITHLASSSSARVQVPAGSLPDGTRISVRYFKDTLRQSDLIPGENNYLFSVLVSWLLGSGSTATVPDTDPNKPITVTLSHDSIKVGTSIFMLIGNQVTPMGTATQDGSVTVELFEDPELVVAQTRPDAPTSLTAIAADGAVSLSWSAPANNGGSQINSYAVTSTPGSAGCVTSGLSCTISGLTNGTSYTFTVTAQNSVGISAPSTPTPGVTPAPESFVVTFDSNGGSSVGNGSFIAGASINQPANPTRSGYNFVGWSTTRDSIQFRITFPFTPSQSAPVTLYALWEVVPPTPSSQQNSGGQVGPIPGLPVGVSVVGSTTVSINDTLVVEGTNLSKVTLVRVGGFDTTFSINAEGKLLIEVPDTVQEGELDLELVGSFGTLTIKGAIVIKRVDVQIDRKVTIGTFLGKVAVYTKNQEGKRLSIRVGKKWFVVDPLKQNYTIHLTKVGSGKDITVMTYLDRKLVKSQLVKIR